MVFFYQNNVFFFALLTKDFEIAKFGLLSPVSYTDGCQTKKFLKMLHIRSSLFPLPLNLILKRTNYLIIESISTICSLFRGFFVS